MNLNLAVKWIFREAWGWTLGQASDLEDGLSSSRLNQLLEGNPNFQTKSCLLLQSQYETISSFTIIMSSYAYNFIWHSLNFLWYDDILL